MRILKKSARWRESEWWIGAAALPVVIRILLVLSATKSPWAALPPYVWARLNADGLILDSLTIVIAAPLVGVAALYRGTAHGGAWIARRCGLTAGAFVLGAAAASLAFHPTTHLVDLVPPYVTLFLAALAMASLGAAAAAWLDHPLDAAACALVLCLAAGIGLFVAGPLLEGAPLAVVNAVLLASPVVAGVSAADIDLLRGEPLYRFSPIGHGQFDYPAWPTACAIYAAIAVLCLAFVVVTSSHRGRAVSTERIAV